MRDFFVHTYDLLLKGLSGLAGFVSGLFGTGAGKSVWLLAVMMIADYVASLAANLRGRNISPADRSPGRPILKKIIVLLLVLLARGLDLAVNRGGDLFLPAVTWFYISNEALSLLSSLSRCGVPVPARLRKLLEGMGE